MPGSLPIRIASGDREIDLLAHAMRRNRSGAVEILLDLSTLDEDGASAWLAFVRAAAEAVGRPTLIGRFADVPADDGSAFAFVSDAAALSRKLLLNVPRIHIRPHRSPSQVDPFFYWNLKERLTVTGLRLEPRRHDVTLISSVYDGDRFLPGFLDNCSALQGYDGCEHYLIRPASPGSEHAALVAHVQRWPSAIYLNLAEDPGLYEVWNFGIRLASGRYLSNANIDDRRAPGHLACLTALLDSQPEAGAAASVLRVSASAGLAWEESAACPLMFADAGEGMFSADALFKQSGAGLASRNLLHCMPVWRRSLHSRFGFFDERRYGPSADWAFWLQCASGGVRFAFDKRPLGLYLRDAGSYWRRNPASATFDARIAEEFGGGAKGKSHTNRLRTSFSRKLGLVIDLLRSGASLEGCGLFFAALLSRPRSGPAELALVSRIASGFFGLEAWESWSDIGIDRFETGDVGDSAVYSAMVDLLHALDAESERSEPGHVLRNLDFACFDLHECSGDMRGLLLFAFLARLRGETGLEQSVLRHLHDEDARAFWASVQSVYRFSRPLQEFCSALCGWAAKPPSATAPQRVNLIHFPTVTGNTYLNLLYGPLRDAGGQVSGTSDAATLLSAQAVPGRENILHIHWVNSVLSVSEERRRAFLDGLAQQKARGFRVFWTIHNYLSHECSDETTEIGFRRSLYGLADKVFVHHPLAANLLDWLPDRDKLQLCEHGPYEVPESHGIPAAAARARLGFADSDLIVTYIGRIRDYKGLANTLPVLVEALKAIPRLRVVIAGQISSRGVREWLASNGHPRLVVRSAYLDAEELALHMAAADFGLLSYSAILTSGTLFHWLSSGRAVLAPDSGTIPAYVVNGWNGFQYSSPAHLQDLLARCASAPARMIESMGSNALHTAHQLDWRLWRGTPDGGR